MCYNIHVANRQEQSIKNFIRNMCCSTHGREEESDEGQDKDDHGDTDDSVYAHSLRGCRI